MSSFLYRGAIAAYAFLALASSASAQDFKSLPFGFDRGREVYPETVLRLNGPDKGKETNLKPLVEQTKYRCTVVWANDPDESVMKLAEAFDGMSHLKRAPLFFVFLFTDAKAAAAKAASLNHVTALRSTRLEPRDWTARKIDPKIKVMIHLMEKHSITQRIDVMAGDITDGRTTELVKEIEAFGSALTAEESSGLITKFRTHGGGTRRLVFSPDGKFLYTLGAERDSGDDIRLAKWQLPEGKELASISVARGGAYGLSITRDGSTLATATFDGMVHFWDTDELMRGESIKTPSSAFSAKLSPDDKRIAVGGSDNIVRIYDVATRKEETVLKGHIDRVRCLDFSPDGKHLVSGDEKGKIKLWDVAAAKQIGDWGGHGRLVECIAFSSDGKTVASCGEDGAFADPGRLRLWDAATGKPLPGPECGAVYRPHGLTFLDGGKTLAFAGDNPDIRIIDVAQGKEFRTIMSERSVILSLGVSRDGTTLASGTWDGTMCLWRLRKEK